MASLIVRNLDDAVVQALKARAHRLGLSAEALHRKILQESLCGPPKKTLAEVLREIPAVGLDKDFERVQDQSAPDVFT